MPANIVARWSPLEISPAALQSHPQILQRSSHCLNIVGDKAYVFFGERTPRVPVASDILEIGLRDRSFRVLNQTQPWPAPRVGAASAVIGSQIYVWGGRGGKEMSPLTGGEEGPWKFDTTSGTWTKLESKGAKPEERSYHTLASDGVDTLYLHAGCPAKGRVGTLHAYHVPSSTWTALPSAPGLGRGGTILASLPSHSPAGRVINFIRYGGFAGHELGHDNEGGLDAYLADKGQWVSVGNEGDVTVNGDHPPRRSVHGLVGVDEEIKGTKEKIRALLFAGESGPAPPELGHAGAGLFHSDSYALIVDPSTPFSFKWQELSVLPSSPTPEPRGWFAAAPWYDARDKSWKAFMAGGLSERNERLGDAWILEIAQ